LGNKTRKENQSKNNSTVMSLLNHHNLSKGHCTLFLADEFYVFFDERLSEA